MTNGSKEWRVLMFAPVCFPATQPEAIVNAKLALALKEAGCSIDVITDAGMVRHWYPHTVAVWRELEKSVHLVTDLPATLPKKLWAKFRTFMLTGHVLQGARQALSAFQAGMALASKARYDVVLSRSNPDLAHLPALMFHRKTGTPWIANWNDPQPWHKFPPPYGDGPTSPMSTSNRRFYRAIAAHCAWHTFPCERLRRYMCSYMPKAVTQRSSVVPHLAMKRFSMPPIPHKGFSICHAGSLRPPRDARVLLEGAKRFVRQLGSSESFSIRFLVEQPKLVADAAKAAGIEDLIKIEPPRAYEEMPKALASADVLAIVEAPMEEGVFFPSKFVDYVQAGRPILALSPVAGTLSDILSAHGGGLAVDGTSPDAVAQAIGVLYKHWKAGTLDSTYGSGKLFDVFGEARVLNQYMDLFRRVSGRTG